MKRVLLINTNKEAPAQFLLERADVELSVITTTRFRHLYPSGTRVEIVSDIEDVEEVRRAALRIRRDHVFEHVLAPSEMTVQAAGYVRSYFGLPGPGYDTVNAFSNKLVMKQRIAAAGLSLARFRRLDQLGEAAEAAHELGWPIVTKPVVGGGAEDVFVIRDAQELRDLCDSERSARLRALPHAGIAEEFIEIDAEYHSDGVVADGEVQFASVAKYFAPVLGSVGKVVGSYTLPESSEETTRVRDLHRQVVRALGLRSGVTHLEVFRVGKEYLIGEIGCRPGGGGVPEQLREQYSLDIWKAFVATGLQEPLAMECLRPEDYLAWFGLPLKLGRVTRMSSLDQLLALPHVVHADLRVAVGDLINRSLNSVANSGIVLLRAATEDEMLSAVKELEATYQFDTVGE